MTHNLQIRNNNLCTHRALVRLFTRMDPHMDEQLVPFVEWLSLAWTRQPHACKVIQLALLYVCILNVLYEIVKIVKALTATIPQANVWLHLEGL